MNGYYTHVDDGESDTPARPSSGVPAEVVAALDAVLHDRPEHWHCLVLAAMAVRPQNWRVIQKAIEQEARSQTTRSVTRRGRKRARRAAAGIQLGSGLIVHVTGDEAHTHAAADATTLIVRPGVGTEPLRES